MTRVGLLFPGEMGTLVGAAVDGEVLWASEGRSDATAERAEGFRDVGTVRELVAASEIVISVCPPAIAEEVAGEVAAEGFEGIYVEANAITPARVTRIAGYLRCVDGSVIARTGVNLYLSGDAGDVAEVAALFPDGDVTAIPLEGGIGAASALKMAFGGWNKIGVALAAQAYAIARAYGVAGRARGRGRRKPGNRPRLRAGLALGAGDGGGRGHRPRRSGFPTVWAARRRRALPALGGAPRPARRARAAARRPQPRDA